MNRYLTNEDTPTWDYMITSTKFTSHPNGEVTYKNLTIEARCPICKIITQKEFGDGNLKNLIGKPLHFWCPQHNGEFTKKINWQDMLPKQQTWDEHLNEILYWHAKIKLAPNTSDREQIMLTRSLETAKHQHPENIFLPFIEEIVTAHGNENARQI